jgi:Ribosomal protein L7/L12
MAATREDVIEFLKNMTLLEASQLVKDLEETFGVCLVFQQRQRQ